MKGCIVEKKPGTFLLKWDSYRDPITGRRKQAYKTVHGTKKEARAELNKILVQLDEGTYIKPEKITLASWLITWLTDYSQPSVTPKTFERYTELLNLHVIPYIGHVHIQKLNGLHIQSLYTTLRKEGNKRPGKKGAISPKPLGEATIVHVHRVLKHALSEGVRSRIIQRNPMLEVKSPRVNKSALGTVEKVHALDKNELGTLIKGFEGYSLYGIVVLAAATGLRRQEIQALRWVDVNFDSKTIQVERAVEETKGGVRIKTPKNKSSRRTIGAPDYLLDVLKKIRAEYLKFCLQVGSRPRNESLVFPTSYLKPEVPKRGDQISKWFVKHCRKHNLPVIRFHDLRHTHATLLLASGVPVNAVSQRLGHSTPTMTLNIYGHVLKRNEAQASQVADLILKDAFSS